MMEIEIILNIEDSLRNRKKINAEVENLKKILSYTETFESFCQSSEVYDLSKEEIISRQKSLLQVFRNRVAKDVFLFIFNKN
jgi:hypothetical protein